MPGGGGACISLLFPGRRRKKKKKKNKKKMKRETKRKPELQVDCLQAVLANDVLQDLADKGRVNADDFRYIPGRTPAPRVGGRGAFSSCAAGRFLFDKEFAGFIIGKGGEKITKIRDQTGATLQFRGPAEEPALFLGLDDRILDIRGTPTQRNQAVECCFKEMDAAPQSIQSTRILIPQAVPEAPLEESVARTGASCSLSQDLHMASPESLERVVRLEGTPSERLAAALGLLVKADEYAPPNAPAASARPPVAVATPRVERPTNGTVAAAPKAASAMCTDGKLDDAAEMRIEPETGKAYTFSEFCVAFAATYSEKDICDYWRDACTPVDKGGHFSAQNASSSECLPLQPAGGAETLSACEPSRAEPEQGLSNEKEPLLEDASAGAACPADKSSQNQAAPARVAAEKAAICLADLHLDLQSNSAGSANRSKQFLQLVSIEAKTIQ